MLSSSTGSSFRCLEAFRLKAIALRLEAIATRVEAIATTVEAIATTVEAIATTVEAIATRLEAFVTRVVEAFTTGVVEAIALRLEVIASTLLQGLGSLSTCSFLSHARLLARRSKNIGLLWVKWRQRTTKLQRKAVLLVVPCDLTA